MRNLIFYVQTLRQILTIVKARNKKYDISANFSITVDVPTRNFADNLPQFLTPKESLYISDIYMKSKMAR